jgi:hypothetical protein
MTNHDLYYVVGIVGIFRMYIYSLGDVYAEYNPKAILSNLTYFLARYRAKQIGLNINIDIEASSDIENILIVNEMRNNHAVGRVKPFAGWLNAVGWCPTCTSFWFMAIFVLPFVGIAGFGISLILSRIIIKWI